MACLSESGVSCWRLRGVSLGQLNQFEMPVNDPESPGNRGPMSLADKAWYRIVRRIAAIPEVPTQDYVQQAVQREANGEAPILQTPEESELLTADLSDNTRWTIQTCIVLFEEIRASEEFETTMLASDSRDSDDEEGSGIQFSPSQVEEFLQTLSRVEISTLGTDNKKCSICKQGYGTTRGDSTKLASDSNQGLPGEEVPEHPVKLSCTLIFGEWGIKTWLLGQPASCPVCRFQFEPVR